MTEAIVWGLIGAVAAPLACLTHRRLEGVRRRAVRRRLEAM